MHCCRILNKVWKFFMHVRVQLLWHCEIRLCLNQTADTNRQHVTGVHAAWVHEWQTEQPVKTSSSLHGPSTLIAHRYFMPRTHCQMPLMIYSRHSDWIQLDWPMCMAISIYIISPHHKTISQHSQECKDPRRQFFVDLWPWPLTFWSQNKWVSTTHHTVTHFYVKFSLETGSLVLWAN